MVDWCT